MSAPLIGSLLGLGTTGLGLALQQSNLSNLEKDIDRRPSATRGQQQELSRRLNARASAGGNNPLRAQREASRQESAASLGFAHAAAAEEAQKRQAIAGVRTERANSLARGLAGLGSGIAGGAQMLGGADKPSPASQVQGPGGALERLSAGRPEITPTLGGPGFQQAPRATAQNPLGMSMPGTLGAPQPQAPTQPAPYGVLGSVLGQQPAPAPQQALPPPPGLTDTPSNQLFPGNFQDVPAQASQPAPSAPQAPQMQGAPSGQPTSQMAPQAVQQAPVATAPVQPQAPATPPAQAAPQQMPPELQAILSQLMQYYQTPMTAPPQTGTGFQ